MKFIYLIRLWVGSCLLLMSSLTWANINFMPQLVLIQLKQVTRQESHEELYFLISDLYKSQPISYTMPGARPYFSHYQTPLPTTQLMPYRGYWQEAELPKLNNIILWHRNLVPQQGTQLLLSLVETDVPPWDLDEVLGTLKLTIWNNGEQLEVSISPYSKYAHIIRKSQQNSNWHYWVRFKYAGAEYIAQFILKANKSSKQINSP